MTDFMYGAYGAKNCHTGNSVVYTHTNGAKFLIGGWNQGATYDWKTHVIDLTGLEHKWQDFAVAYDKDSEGFLPFINSGCAGWLSLPFPDYGTPNNLKTRQQWEGVKNQVLNILEQGKDVLVACHGGHGRSGLFCAIVGYLLSINKDRSWSSPVEKLRKIHCIEAVETYNQEKFVYDVLGLSIQVTHTYIQKSTIQEKCPICGTMSSFIVDFGMCLTCKTKYEKIAPLKHELTTDDFESPIKHNCDRKNCAGIWKADICGHVVHDMLIWEGLCEDCYSKFEDEKQYGKSVDEKEEKTTIPGAQKADLGTDDYGSCVICGRSSMYGKRFGVCYDCSEELQKQHNVDEVHNTITDPYRAVPHHCEDVACVGVVKADVCLHVVHNREIEDGVCPHCAGGKKHEV